ncbi:MAG: response regulator [Candidatus Eremiobacterota bacterium]
MKEKILIVDDEPQLCSLLEVILKDSGYDVTTLQEAPKTIETIRKTGNPDLIILDVVMPEMTGWEVCDKIKENPEMANIPIMFLTVSADSKDVEKGFTLGAESYMCKPFKPMDLIERIKNIIEKKS